MESLKAKVVKPARRAVAKKKTGQALAEDTRKKVENTISEAIKDFTGQTVSDVFIATMLKNLGIDPTVPLSDNDKFLLYNLLTEPIVPLVAESESGYEIKKDVEGQTLEVDIQNYEAEIEAVDEKLQEILPSNRVIGLYDVLPSLRSNRINFAIEKDIFRNKPLLGKGQFRCKFCDSVNTEDYEIQTRRADEGAIVKVICRDCTKQYIL